MSDEGLSAKAMNGEALSEEEAVKIKDFLSGNQQFRQMTRGGPAGDSCFDSLTDDQK
jgi:hypothetical protein